MCGYRGRLGRDEAVAPVKPRAQGAGRDVADQPIPQLGNGHGWRRQQGHVQSDVDDLHDDGRSDTPCQGHRPPRTQAAEKGHQPAKTEQAVDHIFVEGAQHERAQAEGQRQVEISNHAGRQHRAHEHDINQHDIGRHAQCQAQPDPHAAAQIEPRLASETRASQRHQPDQQRMDAIMAPRQPAQPRIERQKKRDQQNRQADYPHLGPGQYPGHTAVMKQQG
jgi:hypothetical protein